MSLARERTPRPMPARSAAAPPPESVLAAMKTAGFNVTHLYGLTEVYGPAVVNDWKREWDTLAPDLQAQKKARQESDSSAVADAVDLENFCETGGNTVHHVGEQGTGQPLQRVCFLIAG